MTPSRVDYSITSGMLRINYNPFVDGGKYVLSFQESAYMNDNLSMAFSTYEEADEFAQIILAKLDALKNYKYNPEREKMIREELQEINRLTKEGREQIAEEIRDCFH